MVKRLDRRNGVWQDADMTLTELLRQARSASFECRCGYHTNVPQLSRHHDCPKMREDVEVTRYLTTQLIMEEKS